MNENEFSYRGKTYIAVEDEADYTCRGCALARMNCYKLMGIGKIPPCRSAYRLDGNNVVFVEKGNVNQ